MKRLVFNRFLLVLVLGIVLAIIVAPSTVLPPIGYFLVRNDPPRTADAVVVLLGGESPDRIVKAAELYKNNLAPKIVIASGYIDKGAMAAAPKELMWPPSSTRYLVALESLGIARENILVFNSDNGVDTEGELIAIATGLRGEKVRSVILVSSATHTRRCGLIWRRVAPDITATVVAAPAPLMHVWWEHKPLVRAVGYEYGALMKELYRQLRNRIVSDDPTN